MKTHPDYSCAKCVQTDGRIILVDVSLTAEASKELLSLPTNDGKELLLLDVREAAGLLEIFLKKFVCQENVLFIFPGNGANYPKSLSKICQQVFSVGVFAKRIWTPGSEPFALSGTIIPKVFMDLRTKTIVVVDDVISSGQTMYKLWRNNEWRFPAAKWIGAAWFSQVLQMKSLSGVKGYSSIFSSILVKGVKGKKVPINSLSTLREQPIIAQSYAKRHFASPDEFLRLIKA